MYIILLNDKCWLVFLRQDYVTYNFLKMSWHTKYILFRAFSAVCLQCDQKWRAKIFLVELQILIKTWQYQMVSCLFIMGLEQEPGCLI